MDRDNGQVISFISTDNVYISWIATGKGCIDLHRAMEIMDTVFRVDRIAMVGGGNINGAFLKTWPIDEVSIMYGAAIDGRKAGRLFLTVSKQTLTHKIIIHII